MRVKNDKCEFEFDDKFAFLVDVCSFHLSKGYIQTYVNQTNLHIFGKFGHKYRQIIKLHRILFELHLGRKLDVDECIDHMDMVKTNNKIENLRIVTHSQNRKNRRLEEGQIYYNICYHKNDNYFIFQHREKKVKRKFRSLHEAFAFFLDYDKQNDHVLTKHIHDMVPMDGIENIVLTPDAKCDKCNLELWSKLNLKTHQKKYHN